MSTRYSRVDEFESVFKATVREKVEIDKLPFERLLVILDCEGSEAKRQSVVDCAFDMADRYKVETRVVAPVGRWGDKEKAEKLLKEATERIDSVGPQKCDGELLEGAPHRIILDQEKSYQPSILLMSSLFGETDEDLETYTLGSVADRVLSSVSEPVLLIEGKVENVGALWSDILVYVEDQKTADSCLAATRTLAIKGAKTALLHVIDSGWLEQIDRAIDLASELDSFKTSEAIVTSLQRDMGHYLTSAADALDRTGHEPSQSIQIGDPIEICRNEVLEKHHGLLICNSVAPDQKLIDSIAYNLAAYMREIPLLLV